MTRQSKPFAQSLLERCECSPTYDYAAAGNKVEAQRLLDELKELSNKRQVSPFSIAIIYAGLDDKDRAFERLDKAFDERTFFIAL